MTTTLTAGRTPASTRAMLNKVPEITIWFWIIKILCTTVGESFADWINMTLGVGLENTSLPVADLTVLREITHDSLDKLTAGDQAGATARITDLETTWDDDHPKLEPLDGKAWTFLDGQIDTVLSAMRASHKDKAAEQTALTALLTSLGSS
ncbi:hypothetical protein AB0M47_15460 [Hamadaea sp. NPDC051192]|uniref:hypothetical protein n=1 Tax=Hamadaea sp. NPDC051192 TaxID=3154940 RepID=UPI003438EBC3